MTTEKPLEIPNAFRMLPFVGEHEPPTHNGRKDRMSKIQGQNAEAPGNGLRLVSRKNGRPASP